MKLPLFLASALVLSAVPGAFAAPGDYFGLRVVDDQTGRGVPLVELKTTSNEVFVTDSNGFAAIGEPELLGQNAYFSVKSHGYEVGADAFGNRGQAFMVKAGGRGELKIHRLNIAQRLYRITGAGIYRDSVLLGEKVPLRNPLLSGGVTGQDTVMATPYKGKLYWFYGDTNRASYPLGNFSTSGATSLLPGKGGLSPDVGIDLTYWTDENGFSKKMLPFENQRGPIWVGGVFTLSQGGRESLWTQYAHLDNGGKPTEIGLAAWNDERAIFEKVRTFDTALHPDGQPIPVRVGGVPFLYFQSNSTEAVPMIRVRADRAHVLDPKSYESFTPLLPGTQSVSDAPAFERDGAKKLVYAWKPNTVPIGFESRKKAVEAGQLKADEVPFQLRDIDSDASIQSHGGSVYWNEFRQKWVMISGQANGSSSYLGELWFAEADTPVGPWVYARKIVTHQKYTFYNPTQHPFFDQNGGRQIYFEGTYTSTYSGAETPTPRYDYNQIMYRLDLDDARLSLPSPVYELRSAPKYAMRDEILATKSAGEIASAPFFAVAPARSPEGLVPLFRLHSGALSAHALAGTTNAGLLCYVLPATPKEGEKPSPAIVPLFQFRDEKTGLSRVSTDDRPQTPTEKREPQPLCRVWRNPATTLALDFDAQPMP